MKNKDKKKRIIVGVLLFVCALIWVGCAGRVFTKENQRTTQKKKVMVVTKSTTSDFWRSVHSGANAASAAYNMDMVFEGPENEEDYETQNRMIRQAVRDKMDAIVFSAVDYHASAAVIDEAAKSGVKIVVIDSDVDSDHVQCRIGTDNYNAGCMAGRAILSGDETELKIGIVNFDVNSANGQEREQGFRDTVGKDERAEIVDTINVISTTEDAWADTKKMLEQYPEINAIVTFNEWTSLGVGYAIQELGLGEQIRVVAFDSNVVSVGMLETGEVDALVVQNPYAMGYLGVETAYRLVNGYEVKSAKIDTSTITVTRENMYTVESQRALFAFE